MLKFLIITSLPIQIYSLDQIIIKIKNINVAKNFTLFDCSECTCPLNITYNNDTFNITSDQLPTNFYFDNNRMLIDSLIQGQNELIISWDSDITKDINNLFKNCEIIETVDFKYFNLQNIIKISHLFDSCVSLTKINAFGPTAAQDMSFLFYNCISLTTIDYETSLENALVKIFHNSKYIGCFFHYIQCMIK